MVKERMRLSIIDGFGSRNVNEVRNVCELR